MNRTGNDGGDDGRKSDTAKEYDDDDDDDDVDDDVDDGDGDVDGMCLQTAREKTGTDQKLQHNAALCRSWSVASSG